MDTFQLQGVSHTLYKKCKYDIGMDVEPAKWSEFVVVFVDRFFPHELRESKIYEFINLK